MKMRATVVLFCVAAASAHAQLPGPDLVSPVGGDVVPPGIVWFDWKKVPDATMYTLQVDPDPSFASPGQIEYETTETEYGFDLSLPQTWFWRVRAKLDTGDLTAWSAVEWFVVCADPFPPTQPENVSPAHQTIIPVAGATFEWKLSTDTSECGPTSSLTYTLTIDDSSLFDAPLVKQIAPLGGPTWTTGPFAPGTYWWRVQARDAVGNLSAWSPAFMFEVCADSLPPTAPEPQDPADNEQLPPAPSLVFTWKDSTDSSDCGPGAVKEYRVLVCHDPGMLLVVLEEFVPGTALVVPGLPPGTYFWTVKAIDYAGNVSPASDVRRFKITDR